MSRQGKWGVVGIKKDGGTGALDDVEKQVPWERHERDRKRGRPVLVSLSG